MKLLFEALFKYIIGLIFVGLLLFLPAQTFQFWNAWLLIALLFIPMFILGIVLFLKNKNLLKKRLKNKEKQKTQKLVILISLIIFVAGFIIASLDFKFGWSNIPFGLVVFASIVLVASYILFAIVLKQNTYLSRTIEVSENQKVIDTGLYGVIRHPMYLAMCLLYLSFPLVLGSWFAFILFLAFPFVLAIRIKNEEEFLKQNLDGYIEYMDKVKYKMIPFIW